MPHSADMIAMEPDSFVSQAPFVHDRIGALPSDLRGSVLLLGNFDGLHLGHRALLSHASELARQTGRPLAILQFDPHPRHHFRGELGFLISGTRVQRRLLAEAGIDLIHAPRFDAAFAGLSAEAFILDHLAGRLGVSAVVTGADFRFGCGRCGDVSLLKAAAEVSKFSVHVVEECCDHGANGVRISSSRIRGAIATGRLGEAEHLLGRPFETAVEPTTTGWRFDPMQILPPDGFFLVEARGAAGRRLAQRMLVLRDRHPEVRLPAGTSTILWHAPTPGGAAKTSLERKRSGL